MRRPFQILLLCTLAASLQAGERSSIPLEMRTRSVFLRQEAQAIAYFDETGIDGPDLEALQTDGYQIIDIQIDALPNHTRGKSAARIQFIPTRSGSIELSSLDFKSETTHYSTETIEVSVSEPERSEQMSLQLTAGTHTVYTGQPLRLDWQWQSNLPAGALKSLHFAPPFFFNEAIEIVIPRNTSPSEQQLGIPLGGRRVIADRYLESPKDDHLGSVKLPIFLRFAEPGTYTLDALRLDCVVLRKPEKGFARYAAHFNNSLFEAPSYDEDYSRVFTTADPITIEVLPLPGAGKDSSFSGLFQPVDIHAEVSNPELDLGQVTEVRITVSSEAPHGMLELAPLSSQRSLRARFFAEDSLSRLWHERGSIFSSRIRPLSTRVQAFPEIRFQVLNPETARYEWITTEAIPLKVNSPTGAESIPLNTFEGANIPLEENPRGIWHNAPALPMDTLLNTLYTLVIDYFWIGLLAGPAGYLIIRPLAIRARRRACDARYRSRTDAYTAFRKCPEGSAQKWQAFLHFLAIHFEAEGSSWTRSDSRRALESLQMDPETIAQIESIHHSTDARNYSGKATQTTFNNLDTLAQKIRKRLLKHGYLAWICLLLLPGDAEAQAWERAEESFARALEATQGSSEADALYQEAALHFEAAAVDGIQPSVAWYNAGNAWFQAGQLGQAIAAYLHAQQTRPFDPLLAGNLSSARSLVLNDIPNSLPWWRKVPTFWIQIFVLTSNTAFWLLWCLYHRYPGNVLKIATLSSGLLLAVGITAYLTLTLKEKTMGVITATAIEGRKGPDYAYLEAFSQPLQDGLEFTLLEQRGAWALIELRDSRSCWIPLNQARLIKN